MVAKASRGDWGVAVRVGVGVAVGEGEDPGVAVGVDVGVDDGVDPGGGVAVAAADGAAVGSAVFVAVPCGARVGLGPGEGVCAGALSGGAVDSGLWPVTPACRVAEACSEPKPLVLPLISYGVSYHHDDFKGTISVSNDTLSRLVYEIGISAACNGILKLVIINGHGGNSPALNYAAQLINRDAKIFVCVDTGDTSDTDIYKIVETPNDVHAGEIETSTSLAVRPDLVDMRQAVRSIPEFSSHYLDFTSKRGVAWYAATSKISAVGVMGDPTKANAEKGKKIWEIAIAHLVGLVEDLKNLSLEEIHHRKD